jgi:molybdopterin converting factor small subunit
MVVLPQGTTVGDLLALWRAEEESELPDSLLIIVNGRNVRSLQGDATRLSHGDEVTLMRPVAGGWATCARR